MNSTLLIVRKSLKHHALSTWITIFAVALSSGLMMSVFTLKSQTKKAFIINQAGFDAVLGARGSQLQLVLNSVYHLETSPGNIPWKLYQKMKKHPMVKLAIPYAVGDNYKGYRIVGTISELFEKFEFRKGKPISFQEGGIFAQDQQQAVLGSFVARRLGLKIGDIIHPYHGLIYNEKMKHDQAYRVSGILNATNTPADKVVWIPIDSFYQLEGHVLRGSGKLYRPKKGEVIPDQHKEVSAVMLKFKSAMAGLMLNRMINFQGKVATLAFPIAKVMLEFFDKMGWVLMVLELIAGMIVIIVGAGILASLYNTMNERRREFAIMRALGAKRGSVFAMIILQSSCIAAIGSLLGFLIYGLIMTFVSQILLYKIGIQMDILSYDPIFWITPLTMVLVGALAGILPAVKAYRTDVATHLSPTV